MGSRRAVVLLTALALAAAGCGGDDEESGADPAATVEAKTALEQDAEAKRDARTLVTLVEVCFIDQQDYTRCVDAGSGEAVGEATVQAPSPTEYVVTAPSESGNEFRIESAGGGSPSRSCTEPGTGGCGADGSW